MTTGQQPLKAEWGAAVEMRDDRLVVIVTRREEPAGMITFEPDDPLDDAVALASAILTLNKKPSLSPAEDRCPYCGDIAPQYECPRCHNRSRWLGPPKRP